MDKVFHFVLQSPSLAPNSFPVRIGGATSVDADAQMSAGGDGQHVINYWPNALGWEKGIWVCLNLSLFQNF